MILCLGGEQGVAVCPATSVLLENKEELLIFVCLVFFIEFYLETDLDWLLRASPILLETTVSHQPLS